MFFLVTPVAFLSPLLVTRSFGNEVWRLTANEVTFFVGSILGGVIMTAWGGFRTASARSDWAASSGRSCSPALGLAQNFVLYLVVMTLAGIPMPF